VKRLLLLVVGAVLVISGCSGGNSVTLPPPTGNFTNASLKGQYAFAMAGQDVSTGAFITRIGSFTADGNGNITAATEDIINTGATGGGRTVFAAGGTYSIQSNGRGIITLIQNSSSGLGLSIAMDSSGGGVMIQTDYNGVVSATSSGSFSLQNPADFSTAGISNDYVFGVSGVEGTMGAPLAMMGQITADGAGTVQSGVIDINNGAASAPDPPAAIPAGGSYGAESANQADLATFGRGAISFNSFTFVFYIVDHTHFLLLEEDASNNTTFGDAFQQSAAIPAQISNFTPGSFAFLVGGSSVIGSMAADARVGRFTTDGGGNLSNVFLDENYGGSNNSVSNNVSAATYSIDTSAVAQGRGRGTFTFTQSSFATFDFVFYLISPTQAVVLDESTGLISSGLMAAQASNISTSTLASNYVFNWSGVFLPSSGNVGSQEDFVGQYSQNSSGSISGAVDFMEPGTTSSHGPLFLNSAVSGSLILNSDPTTRNDYDITISTSGVSPGTINFKAYIANSNTIFLLSVGSNQVLAGTVVPQP
jgi:hypothetical protein